MTLAARRASKKRTMRSLSLEAQLGLDSSAHPPTGTDLLAVAASARQPPLARLGSPSDHWCAQSPGRHRNWPYSLSDNRQRSMTAPRWSRLSTRAWPVEGKRRRRPWHASGATSAAIVGPDPDSHEHQAPASTAAFIARRLSGAASQANVLVETVCRRRAQRGRIPCRQAPRRAGRCAPR